MKQFQMGGVLIAIFLWGNISIAAMNEGRYSWCLKRVDNLKEQMTIAKTLDSPERIKHLEAKLKRVHERCKLSGEPFVIDPRIDHDRDNRRDRPHYKECEDRGEKQALENRMFEERLEIEHKILEQKETIIHISSDIRKAEYVGDHLQVKLIKEDLEREHQILELYQEELEKIESREK